VSWTARDDGAALRLHAAAWLRVELAATSEETPGGKSKDARAAGQAGSSGRREPSPTLEPSIASAAQPPPYPERRVRSSINSRCTNSASATGSSGANYQKRQLLRNMHDLESRRCLWHPPQKGEPTDQHIS
jgi:hypothetical protein